MNPHLEYNGTTYEFEGTFSLRKSYEKEVQNKLKELIKSKGLTQEDLEELRDLQDIDTNTDIANLDDNTKNKLIKANRILSDINNDDINEKYCFLMLNQKYGIEKQEWNQMIEQYFNDYCDSISEVYEMLQKVIQLVFTRKASTPKKQKPSWVVEN